MDTGKETMLGRWSTRILRAVILCLCCSFWQVARAQETHEVTTLDLSPFPYLQYPRVKLKGAWKFYPSVLLEPGDKIPERAYELEPGRAWNDLPLDSGQKMGSFGYGTYRITFKGLRQAPQGYVLTTAAGSAAKAILYVEGHPEETRSLAVGQVGVGRDERPSKRDLRLRFYPRTDLTYILLLQVSNHTQFLGGARWDLVLAENDAGVQIRSVDGALNILCIGVMAGLGIFSFLMWMRWRSDRSSLYLALAAFTVMVRTVGTNAFLVELFSDDAYRMLRNCEYLGMSGGGMAYILYLKSSFYPQLKSRFISLLVLVGAVLSIGCFTLPHYWLTRSLPLFQIYVAITGATWVVIVFAASRKHLEGSGLVLVGSTLILAAALSDIILVSYLGVLDHFLTPLAVASFLGLQAQAHAIRSARHFAMSQKFAKEREEAQKALRLEVESRLLLASDLAHRLNNPLNYVLTGTTLLADSAIRLHAALEAMFEGSEGNAEAYALKQEFDDIISGIGNTIALMEEGVRRSNGVVDEIRALSGVDGVALNRTSFALIIEGALERLASNLGTAQRARYQVVSPEADREFFASYQILVVAMEQILRYLILRSERSIHLTWTEQLETTGKVCKIMQRFEGAWSNDEVKWLELKDRLNHILKPCSIQIQSEVSSQRLLVYWLIPANLLSEALPTDSSAA